MSDLDVVVRELDSDAAKYIHECLCRMVRGAPRDGDIQHVAERLKLTAEAAQGLATNGEFLSIAIRAVMSRRSELCRC